MASFFGSLPLILCKTWHGVRFFFFFNSFLLLLCTSPRSHTVTRHVHALIIKPITPIYCTHIQHPSGSFWPPPPVSFCTFLQHDFIFCFQSAISFSPQRVYMQEDRIWMLLMKLIKRQTSHAFFSFSFSWRDRQISFIILLLLYSFRPTEAFCSFSPSTTFSLLRESGGNKESLLSHGGKYPTLRKGHFKKVSLCQNLNGGE